TLNDGGNNSGAQTSTLTLSNVLAADVGGYSVIVSNAYGSVTSAVAALAVNQAVYSVLHDFSGSDGANPYANLTLSGSTLYGTTAYGGSSGNGTVFAVNTDGTGFTTLYSFTAVDPTYGTNSDGAYPSSGLILSDNTLYGTANLGGGFGNGTVFSVKTDGTSFTVLKEFGVSNLEDQYAKLTLSGSTLYGTAKFGDSDYGTVFSVNTDGTGFTVLKEFNGDDGAAPSGGLLLSGTTLYGTTVSGGNSGYGTVFAVNTDGTGFTTLYSFTGGSDGANSNAGLILSGNTLYGTAYGGGDTGNGTVFSVNTDGTGFTVLK